jgi:purine catabolism regulator
LALTIDDVMKFPIMESSRVKTAKQLIGNRVVEWVSVIETPVENFIRENEFVLSTGIGCGHDPELFVKFVRDVYDSGASALGVALGRHIYDIPPQIVQFAEEKDFVIIEVPWEVRFADISERVLNELNTARQHELKRSAVTQQHLIDLILRGKGLADIANYVWREIRRPVVITDQMGNIKGYSQHSREIIKNWDTYIQSNKILQTDPEQETAQNPSHKKLQKVQLGEPDVFQMKIISAGNHSGYLFLFSFKEDLSLTQSEINLLEHAVTASALWFLRENAIAETEMRLQDDLIWSLAKEEISSKERMYSRAKLLGYNLNIPYVCILGFAENLDTLYKNQDSEYFSRKHWVNSMIYYIQEEILYASEAIGRQVMLTHQNGEEIIFLETPHDNHHETVNHYLDLVDRRLNKLLPGVVFSWGIGQHQEGILVFHESFDKAQTALDIGRRQKSLGYRVTYEDTKMYRLLYSVADHKDIREITMMTIEPLLVYDKKRGMDLIGTFTAYNEHKSNVSQTARTLNLHRQSLLYRLRKIESLTGLSLINSDDLFLLDLSIKIWSLGSLK